MRKIVVMLLVCVLLCVGCGTRGLAFDDACLEALDLAYGQALDAYGEETGRVFHNGGCFIQFQRSEGKLLFDPYEFVADGEVLLDASAQCTSVLVEAGAIFRNYGDKIDEAAIEELLETPVIIEPNMAHGGYNLHFNYDGYRFLAELSSEVAYLLPTDKLMIRKDV